MKNKITDALKSYLTEENVHFPVVREKMPTPNKIKKDAEKILQGFDKKTKSQWVKTRASIPTALIMATYLLICQVKPMKCK